MALRLVICAICNIHGRKFPPVSNRKSKISNPQFNVNSKFTLSLGVGIYTSFVVCLPCT